MKLWRAFVGGLALGAAVAVLTQSRYEVVARDKADVTRYDRWTGHLQDYDAATRTWHTRGAPRDS